MLEESPSMISKSIVELDDIVDENETFKEKMEKFKSYRIKQFEHIFKEIKDKDEQLKSENFIKECMDIFMFLNKYHDNAIQL